MQATTRTVSRILSLAVAIAATGSAGCSSPPGGDRAQGRDGDATPRFTADGRLLRPQGWESWVMVGASLGLSYDSARPAPVPGAGPGTFHTIFVQPWAYRSARETGAFPQNTMFILAMAKASREADPARAGAYEGERRLAEIHLKREGLSSTGWGFFGFGRDADSAAMIPETASCYDCHSRNGGFDQVFTQFYPPLRDLGANRTVRP